VTASAGDTELAKLGKYELITQIGQGGMAEVQLAIQRGPGGFEKLVVVKLVHKNLAAQKTFVDMLLDEARVAALVKHPNVVDIYDLGEAGGRYFIAMEYLEGEPLLGLLRAGREGKRLDPLSTARLIADTAEGLDAAHELQSIGGDPMELVHHDVSLGNIMVLYNGQVKLVDFGVAKASESAGPQMKVHGKFGYMAPEKLKGRGSDRRGDIWSLGVVLWEALTLRRLFRGTSEQDTMRMVLEHPIQKPSTLAKELPPQIDAIVMKALERDPDRRYARAKDLAQDLEEVLRQQGYGGRNDQIARYMQATFSAHIAARKKLLHEVMQKGKASDDVLTAAFDEGPGSAPRNIRPTGDFSIAFKGNQTPIPRSSARISAQLPAQDLAESSSVSAILQRRSRNSEEMMAEGTPHSVVDKLPKRISKQMPAPILNEDDPESYDRNKYPDVAVVESKPINDDSVMAVVASLQPPVSTRAKTASLPPASGPSHVLDRAIEIKLELDETTRHERPATHDLTLQRWDDEVALDAKPIEDVEESSRPSQQMRIPARPTSRRLEVVAKPRTSGIHEPVAIVVEERSKSPLLIVLLIVGLLAVAGVAIVFVL
jgi:serine/threonine protein kinase